MTITIPNIGNNPLVVIVGGKRYAYGAGETVTVPDEVGNEILHMKAAMDKPAPPVVPPLEDAVNQDIETDIQGLDTRLSAVEAALPELPEFPETDGTYSLQLVMDDGVGTLSWEAVGE